jgi:hypothetical protein
VRSCKTLWARKLHRTAELEHNYALLAVLMVGLVFAFSDSGNRGLDCGPGNLTDVHHVKALVA